MEAFFGMFEISVFARLLNRVEIELFSNCDWRTRLGVGSESKDIGWSMMAYYC